MKFNLVLKSILITIVVVFVASCDTEYNELGTNILGGDHYGLESDVDYPITFTQTSGPVQTNDLPVNSLGVYNMGNFGTTKASFQTQLGLSEGNVKIYSDLTSAGYGIDSVYVYIPYFSTVVSTNSETGNSTYELDSIMPSNYTGRKFNLEIRRSTLNLNDYDIDEDLTQLKKYYSNDQPTLEANLSDVLLNTEIPVSDSQILFYKKTTNSSGATIPGDATNGAAIDSRLAPGIFSLLDTNYFKNLLIPLANNNSLSNNNFLLNNGEFRNFFKGLYIKASTPSGGIDQAAMARFNFASARIVIIYHDHYSSTSTTSTRKVLSLGFSGRSVNVFDTSAATPISTGNASTGDEWLYVKGGEGAQAVIKISDVFIQNLKDNKAKINDAVLSFTLDDSYLSNTYPRRFYLYDIETRRVLLDYTYDPTTSTSSKYNKYIFGGIEKTIDGKKRVRFNITNHLRNLTKTFTSDEISQGKDTIKNYKLGLAITENINVASLYRRKNIITDNTIYKNKLKYLPIMSTCSPLGARLYGSVLSAENTEDTRVKLEIWYTKPEE